MSRRRGGGRGGGGKRGRQSGDASARGGAQPEGDEPARSSGQPGGDASTNTARVAPTPETAALSSRKRALFFAITLLVPLLLLALVEGALRVLNPDGGNPLIVQAEFGNGRYAIANAQAGVRWFGTENSPAARMEPFLHEKPTGALRLVALGESSTYGFPHAPTASFPRVLEDMLRDVQPGRHVEVVNLGIPATNSWTLRDIAGEVLRLEPDAVLIYAGHNEYYGALGVASTAGGGASPLLVRATLLLQRLRIGQAVRSAVVRLRSGSPAGNGGTPGASQEAQVATYMETIASQDPIDLDGSLYRAGVRQFSSNLSATVAHFVDAGVPVLLASLTSNLRDQAPLVSSENDGPGAAREVYLDAHASLAGADTQRDSAALLQQFMQARDLDVVRFRAPTAFDTVVTQVAEQEGAVYVPVRERFNREAAGGIPGNDLFSEHVHPHAAGQAILADEFALAIRQSGLLPDANWELKRELPAYVAAMSLTRFDSLLAEHTVRTVTSRWPFVPVDQALDYRGTYSPVDRADSLALLTSRGGLGWLAAKGLLADEYMRAGRAAESAMEYAGIVRMAPPVFEEPWRRYAAALLQSGELDAADRALQQAVQIQPTPAAEMVRAQLLLARGDSAGTVAALKSAVGKWPNDPALRFQLSLAYGLMGDMNLARSEALHVLRLRRDFPGLVDWLRNIAPEEDQ